jgi:glycosyltransferase involved in cell wall biosynthesis
MYNSLKNNSNMSFDMYKQIKTYRQTYKPTKFKLQEDVLQIEQIKEEKEKEKEKETQTEEFQISKDTPIMNRHLLLKDNTNINFCFIISSYNNSLNIEKNLNSVINQTYTKWRAIYINDNSSDNTEELYFEIIKNTKMEKKFIYIKNDKRCYQMHNKYMAYKLVNDLEIICILDGDDWLLNENVLEVLKNYYTTTNYKIISSNYKVYDNNIISPESKSEKFYSNIELTNNVVRYNNNWYIRHLKTGYAIFFKSISEEYLKYKDEWLNICTDCAEIYCVIEFSKGNIIQIQEPLYVYNRQNSKLYPSSYYNSKNSEKRLNILNTLRTLPICKYSFPKTYIINLSIDSDKKINMMKQLMIMKNNNYEFIEGINGNISVDTTILFDNYINNYFVNRIIHSVTINNEILELKNDFSKYINKKQHITKGSLGLLQSIFKILNKFITDDKIDHILIFEDDIFTLKDIDYNMFINTKLLENKDLIYLGCHNNNNKIYDNINDNDVFINITDIPYLIYGCYSIIISKKLAKYILSIGLNEILKLNMSWDIFLNFLREYKKSFSFYLYFKELFIPDVIKDGINGIRDNSFYKERGINLENYVQNK